MNKKLAVLSNGHGEDLIAITVLNELKSRGADLEIISFPLVGEGSAYVKNGYPLEVPVRKMPSGGFFYQSSGALWNDLANGLINHFLSQLKTVKQLKNSVGGVFAVGDILPLYLAHMFERPFIFYGSAKSEYQNRKPATPVYSWLERHYLKGERCKGAYFRDGATADRIKTFGIHAQYAGNPMMDGLEPSGVSLVEEGTTLVGILPGSRDDSIGNLETILLACINLYQRNSHLVFAAAITESVKDEQLMKLARRLQLKYDNGPPPFGSHIWDPKSGCRIHLARNLFNDIIHQAKVVIGLAGTANEQAAGLGKPIVSFIGGGTQYTKYFAENQRLLLGETLNIVEPSPKAISDKVAELLADSALPGRLEELGLQRMGRPGASRILADRILEMTR